MRRDQCPPRLDRPPRDAMDCGDVEGFEGVRRHHLLLSDQCDCREGHCVSRSMKRLVNSTSLMTEHGSQNEARNLTITQLLKSVIYPKRRRYSQLPQYQNGTLDIQVHPHICAIRFRRRGSRSAPVAVGFLLT